MFLLWWYGPFSQALNDLFCHLTIHSMLLHKCIMYFHRSPTSLIWLNKALTVRSSNTNNTFNFQSVEAGVWSVGSVGAQWISNNFCLQFSSLRPRSSLDIPFCCYLQYGQKLLHPINATTSHCLPFFVCFSIDRQRGREEAGKKSSWIKHLSSRGIFVSSCQNPNVLWRDISIFQRFRQKKPRGVLCLLSKTFLSPLSRISSTSFLPQINLVLFIYFFLDTADKSGMSIFLQRKDGCSVT